MDIRSVDIETILPLRQNILRPGRTLDQARFSEDRDLKTFHLAAFKNAKVIGVATFMQMPSTNYSATNQYRLRGMAVDQQFRNQKVGQALFQKGIEILKKRQVHYLWFNAREKAVEFYKHQGAKIYGDKFEVPEIGSHYYMYNRL